MAIKFRRFWKSVTSPLRSVGSFIYNTRHHSDVTFPAVTFIAILIGALVSIYKISLSGGGVQDFNFVVTTAVLALLVALASLYLSQLKLRKTQNESISQTIRDFTKREIVGGALNRKELYAKMHSSVFQCWHDDSLRGPDITISVTSYIAKHPNRDIDEVVLYHQQLDRIIKSDQMGVRRVVSITTREKLEWVEQQLDEYKHCKNYTLCLDRRLSVPRVNPAEKEFQPRINIQLYGRTHSFMFGPRTNSKSHHSKSDNLYLQGEGAVSSFMRFYEDLWNECSSPENLIINDGEINEAALAEVRDYFSQKK